MVWFEIIRTFEVTSESRAQAKLPERASSAERLAVEKTQALIRMLHVTLAQHSIAYEQSLIE